MKIPNLRLSLALASLLVFTAIGSGAVAQDQIVDTKSYSVAKDKAFEVSVKVPTEPVALAAFTFSITVTNRTSTPLDFIDVAGIPRCVISVFTKDGRECERTSLGSFIIGPKFSGSWMTGLTVVAPGQSHTWDIALHEIFVLEPGKYKMTVRFGMPPKKGGEGIAFTIR
jgi:hypothetical protein